MNKTMILQNVITCFLQCLSPFQPLGYDMSTYIRRYSKYLNQKALSYRTVAFDFCRVKRGYVEITYMCEVRVVLLK